VADVAHFDETGLGVGAMGAWVLTCRARGI
jgi:hypothetical protein